jgi:isoaspartyl peptidase/L-asparaginase-like protein (Ntn-hydrolase superfamily)
MTVRWCSGAAATVTVRWFAGAAAILALGLACRAGGAAGPSAPTPPRLPLTAAAIAHGGAGSPSENADGCRAAVDVALATLALDNDPLEAAVAGVVVLENDPRFNAGTGSIVRLDGSIQMDASVMSSEGRFGAVAGLERVKNPIKVARAVLETPHLLLMGDGAIRFARSLGLADYDPTTPQRREATEKVKQRIRTRAADLPPFWRGDGWRQRWNYPTSPAALGLEADEKPGPQAGAPASTPKASDTVGVAVRASDGRYGVALSTGGTGIVLRGRVGDVPIYGAGLYAGPAGAAAATGTGERIIEKQLAHTVYDWLAAGASPAEAAHRAIALVPNGTGIIVIDATGLAAASDTRMAWAGREANGPWQGPTPSSAPAVTPSNTSQSSRPAASTRSR